MSKLHQRKRWISLAVAPLFSMAVLAGCSSSDDDDDGDNPVDPGEDVVVVDPVETPSADTDGDGIPNGFQTDDTALDSNGNTINDAFEAADAADDTNENLITDSLEAELTGGPDADNDGVDDDALAALNGDTGGTQVVEVEPIDQTGDLNPITLSNGAGTANFAWDGANLSGTVTEAADETGAIINDGIQITSVSVDSGIFAVGTTTQPVGQTVLNLNGSSPTFSTPNPIDPSIASVIAENIVGGNLFVTAQLSNGGVGQGTILLPGVAAQFSNLASENNVPAPETNFFSGGAGSININTVTGDIAASVRVDVIISDVDAAGNAQSVTAVSINEGAADATGPIIVPLTLSPDGFYTAVQQLSTENLSSVLTGNAYFEVLGTDGNPFIRGQIPASQ